MQGSGIYVKRNGLYVELPKKKKSSGMSWQYVFFWVCLSFGMLVGYILNNS